MKQQGDQVPKKNEHKPSTRSNADPISGRKHSGRIMVGGRSCCSYQNLAYYVMIANTQYARYGTS